MDDFTIENFVDVVNEMLLQITHDEERFKKLEELNSKYAKGEIDIDPFAFEVVMIIQGK